MSGAGRGLLTTAGGGVNKPSAKVLIVDDSLYGNTYQPNLPHVHLGDLAQRGERGVLAISPGDMLRIRWNPFYSYIQERMLAFVELK